MGLDLAPSRSNDDSQAWVSCISGGYNLHRFIFLVLFDCIGLILVPAKIRLFLALLCRKAIFWYLVTTFCATE